MSDKEYSSVWVQDKTVDKQLLNTSCILDPGSNAITWLCQEWLCSQPKPPRVMRMAGHARQLAQALILYPCLKLSAFSILGPGVLLLHSIAGEGHSLNMFWNFLIRLSAGIYLGLKKCFPDDWGSSWLDGLVTSTGLLGALSLLRNRKHVG